MKNALNCLLGVCFYSVVSAQSFTPGNIVVLGVGDGSTALTSAAAPVFLYEYTTAGTLVSTTPLPTVSSGANHKISQSGSSIVEGSLSLSYMGNYLHVAGYDADAGTANVVGSTAPGVIAMIDKNRTVNTANSFSRASIGSPYYGGNFTAATSLDGQSFWLSGNSATTGGVYTCPDGGSPSRFSSAGENYTGPLQIMNAYTGGGGPIIYKVYPKKLANGTFELLGIIFTDEPLGFVMLDASTGIAGPDLLYVATGGPTGGIRKYSSDGNAYVSRGSLTGACGGIAARRNCSGGADLYVTRFEGGLGKSSETQLIKITDNAPYNFNITGDGSSMAPAPAGISTLLATAPLNTAFCGVAFTPADAIMVNPGTSVNIPAGSYNSIFVDNNATATLSGDVTIFDQFIMAGGSTLVTGSYTVQSSAGKGTLFEMRPGGSTLKIGSPYGITTSQTGPMGGNIQTCYRRYEDRCTYEYNGTVPQFTGNALRPNIQSVTGSTGRLVINNSAGLGTNGVTLSQHTIISAAGELVLSNGKLTTSTSSAIFVDAGGVVITSYSDNSFVNGPFNRYGNTTFKFPVGKGNTIHPIELVPTVTGNGNDFYSAEYFNSAPSTACPGSMPTGSIDHVSGLEYWSVKTFMAFSQDAANRVTLWATTYSQATDRDKLVIARCDSPNWTDMGNSNLTNTGAYGPVISNLSASGDYNSIFTLASIEPSPVNPLPLTLVSFDAARLSNTRSSVNWETGTVCPATTKFEIERAGPDKTFITINTTRGNNVDRVYNFIDADLKNGINYYRLKMIDENGKAIYSRTVAVMNGVSGLLFTSLMPTVVTNSATLTVASSQSKKFDMMIIDMQGRVMRKHNYAVAEGNTSIEISTEKLAAGMYQLTGVTAEGKTNMIRFIKQ